MSDDATRRLDAITNNTGRNPYSIKEKEANKNVFQGSN
jgi:hypothetical protein